MGRCAGLVGGSPPSAHGSSPVFDGRKDPLAEGLKQIDAYLGGLGLDEGVLVLFDQRSTAAPVEERTGEEATETASGRGSACC